MNNLGKSLERYKNGGAQFAFWLLLACIIFLIGFIFIVDVEIDTMGITMYFISTFVLCCLEVYLYFKSKTEIDLREKGIYIRNISKKHEILYSDIAKIDKTKRIGKSANTIIIFYLLVIETKNGKRVTFPCRITEDFIKKFLEISQIDA